MLPRMEGRDVAERRHDAATLRRVRRERHRRRGKAVAGLYAPICRSVWIPFVLPRLMGLMGHIGRMGRMNWSQFLIRRRGTRRSGSGPRFFEIGLAKSNGKGCLTTANFEKSQTRPLAISMLACSNSNWFGGILAACSVMVCENC